MAEFKVIDQATFEATARGRVAKTTPRAIAARFDRRTGRIVVKLDTGIDFAFDPGRARRLTTAAPDDLVGVVVEGAGRVLHFPKIDVDLRVGRLLEGFLGLMDWNRQEARAGASRRNGRLGGRPKRLVAAS